MIWKVAGCLVLGLVAAFLGREGYARYQERETMRTLELLGHAIKESDVAAEYRTLRLTQPDPEYLLQGMLRPTRRSRSASVDV